jgi:hypothetical protein
MIVNGDPNICSYSFILSTILSAPYVSTYLNGPPFIGGNPRPNTAPISPSVEFEKRSCVETYLDILMPLHH